MTTRHGLLAAALAACCLLPAGLSAPAAPDDESAARETEESEAVKTIALAYKLADYGRASKPPAPMALVTAADILCRIPVKGPADSADRVRVEARDNERPAAVNSAVLKDEAERLLDEARRLKGGDRRAVADEIQRVAELVKSRGRGGVSGPLVYALRLAPHQTDTFTIKFKQGEWARVAVHAAGPARLSLRAVNALGDRRADDSGRDPAIAWVPQQRDGSDYKVTVTNQGTGEVLYQLFTN